jgi:hypothetical protein
MTTKHTPGPWTIEPHGATTALYADRDDGSHGFRGINLRHGLRLMNLDDGDSNFEANARLIAAAPELLEALKWILDYTESDGYADAIYGERWVKTKQLLARIDGETT